MRNHPSYWAFVVHRVSGLGLVLFLPFHFYVLSLALEEARLNSFLQWTDAPLVKLAETGLVILLAAHMGGGLRLLVLEFLPWHDWQKTLMAIGGAVAFAFGILFLVRAI
ncbi:MAG TPA: succinate dehydrogenase [Rhodospirillaceae bacterium]|nr:succinate dehydrogenase [Rhodospirillaceae bacterium]HAA92291.1 succinate dehydrogenase [Rhodospirillaceae bacterium]HAT35983.1 succinate dehydrogenase [Rhodospirillaceae bacterium]|tara:strand:+ start:354 stop:680 length:327 start_codon:yes stop_codon:yes gene_type:complete